MRRVPRICGGVSIHVRQFPSGGRSSPHLRGCFREVIPRVLKVLEFPASAGVFLREFRKMIQMLGVPRICGGVSRASCSPKSAAMSSPHLRGCFLRADLVDHQKVEFPASAGVFLEFRGSSCILLRVPRICGGVSASYDEFGDSVESSPHLRGCFHNRRTYIDALLEFPASAGVFRRLAPERAGRP